MSIIECAKNNKIKLTNIIAFIDCGGLLKNIPDEEISHEGLNFYIVNDHTKNIITGQIAVFKEKFAIGSNVFINAEND
jgi:hypothetical protein